MKWMRCIVENVYQFFYNAQYKVTVSNSQVKKTFGITHKQSFRGFCENGLRPVTLLKKSLWHMCFPVNFAKFLKTAFFYRPPLVAASDNSGLLMYF